MSDVSFSLNFLFTSFYLREHWAENLTQPYDRNLRGERNKRARDKNEDEKKT